MNLGAVAQVMYLGFSAPPGKDVAEEWRWEVENTHETEVGKETTDSSISANGKYNIQFSCALAVERFPPSRQRLQLPSQTRYQ